MAEFDVRAAESFRHAIGIIRQEIGELRKVGQRLDDFRHLADIFVREPVDLID